jgi:crossover junction endodeoxyribonuclease RusA
VGGVITLILPYPVSANDYWRTRVIKVKGRQMPSVYVTEEAREYRRQVAAIAQACGVKPLTGRLSMHLQLYPHRPLDWQARMRKHGAAWDDDVLCLDIGNAEKVLGDALQGIAYENDKWIWKQSKERMEPDAEGKRVVVRIEQMHVAQPQLALVGEPA